MIKDWIDISAHVAATKAAALSDPALISNINGSTSSRLGNSLEILLNVRFLPDLVLIEHSLTGQRCHSTVSYRYYFGTARVDSLVQSKAVGKNAAAQWVARDAALADYNRGGVPRSSRTRRVVSSEAAITTITRLTGRAFDPQPCRADGRPHGCKARTATACRWSGSKPSSRDPRAPRG